MPRRLWTRPAEAGRVSLDQTGAETKAFLLPSYCLALEKTAPNVQKSSRKREEERSQDRAPSKPPKGAHTVAVPAFVEAAAHRAVHLLNVIFTK